MKKHTKKIIPLIVILIIQMVYLLAYAVASIFIGVRWFFFLGLLFAAIAGVGIILSIYTMIERIKEIRNGEEDDLSQY